MGNIHDGFKRPSEYSQKAREVSTILLYLLSFLGETGVGMVRLSIPILAYHLKASTWEIGLIGGSMSIIYCFAPALLGRASDALGRKRLVAAALLLYSGIAAAYPFSQSVVQLLLLGVITGFSTSILWFPLEALIVDIEKDLEGALRKYNISWGIGWLIWPPVAGALISLDARVPFYVVAAFTFPAALATLVFIKEPKVAKQGKGGRLKEGKNPIGLSHLSALGATYLLGFLGGYLLSIFPAQAVAVMVSPMEVGVAVFLYGIARILIFLAIPSLRSLFERSALLTLGVCLYALAMLPLSLGFAPHLFYTTFLIAGMAAGITFSASIATLLEAEGRRGERAGLFESIVGFGFFTGPIVGGAAATLGPSIPYLVCLALSLGIAVFQVLCHQRMPIHKALSM